MDRTLVPEISPLEAEEVNAYAEMTFPHYRRVLARVGEEPSVIAVKATVDAAPVGLGLARVGAAPRPSRVLSLFVATEHRSAGVGTRLLAQLEAGLQERGARHTVGTFMTGTPSAPAVERIFARRGWSTPTLSMLVCHADRRILESPWLRRAPTVSGYNFAAWRELTESDREGILRITQEHPVPDDPFRVERDCDPHISVLLRRDSEPVGWYLTHRLRPDLLRYTSLYVRPDARQLGLSLALIRETSRRHVLHMGLETRGMWGTPISRSNVAPWIQKQLAPHLASLREIHRSEKWLPGGAEASP